MDDPPADRTPPPDPPPPHPSPTPVRRSPPPARSQGGRGDQGPDRGRGGPHPTPRDPLASAELPWRTIRAGSEDWVIREAGRTASGTGGDSRAPLVLLFFARAEEPERPLRELLTGAGRLHDFTDDYLIDLLAASRPVRPEQDRQEVFPDTRKRGGKGM